MLLAGAVAVLHGAAVLFMLTGSLLALRRPWVLWVHVPLTLTIAGLYLTGSDCPVTTWELALRQRAGEPAYRDGFIGHYVTDPLGFPIHATSTQVGIYVLAFLPNVIGYGLLARRALIARRAPVPPARPEPASPRSRLRPPAKPAAERDRRPTAPGPRG